MKKQVVIIGAGLTGLSTAFFLKKKGFEVLVLEKRSRTGGAIHTHTENGFVYEEGPNTGVIGNPETAELFEMLGIDAEIANEKANNRLILKNGKWHSLPSDPIRFLLTPLFSLKDKIGIAFEPFHKKGSNPDESVASLASRRIGQSFVDYAVNPFISGIYAGDPEKLITRYALPKLYNLEQKYGSFIGGTFKKSREPKTERDKKATRKVFSTQGGLHHLISKLEESIGKENIMCDTQNTKIFKQGKDFKLVFDKNGTANEIVTSNLISTIGAHDLSDVLTFVNSDDMASITNINYAKMVEVAVGVKKQAIDEKYLSFGGLIPQKENKNLLGVLFPSFCFDNRSPKDYATLAIYLGGVRHPEFIDLADEAIEKLVKNELETLFKIKDQDYCFMKIFRHPFAIPQYELSSGERFMTIKKVEAENKGLIIAGNLRDGIGMSDRIKQAYDIACMF